MLPQEEVCDVGPEEAHEIRKLESLCQISKSGCRLSATPAAACAVASVTDSISSLKQSNAHPTLAPSFFPLNLQICLFYVVYRVFCPPPPTQCGGPSHFFLWTVLHNPAGPTFSPAGGEKLAIWPRLPAAGRARAGPADPWVKSNECM